MEEVIYKHRPHIYAALSVFALAASKGSSIMAASGIVLMACAVYVLKARADYKKEMVRMARRYSQSPAHSQNLKF